MRGRFALIGAGLPCGGTRATLFFVVAPGPPWRGAGPEPGRFAWGGGTLVWAGLRCGGRRFIPLPFAA